MKAADLSRATALVDEGDRLRRLARKLAAEPLRLTVGMGGDATEIALSQSYRERMKADVSRSVDHRLAEIGAELAAMGIEP